MLVDTQQYRMAKRTQTSEVEYWNIYKYNSTTNDYDILEYTSNSLAYDYETRQLSISLFTFTNVDTGSTFKFSPERRILTRILTNDRNGGENARHTSDDEIHYNNLYSHCKFSNIDNYKTATLSFLADNSTTTTPNNFPIAHTGKYFTARRNGYT